MVHDAKEGPECVPLDDVEFRINARTRLDLPPSGPTRGFASQRRPKAGGILGARSVALLDQRENDSHEVNDRSMSHRDGSTCTSFIAHAVLALATSCWDVPVVTIHTELMSRALQCSLDQVKN